VRGLREHSTPMGNTHNEPPYVGYILSFNPISTSVQSRLQIIVQ
jgi:hypothetical protein